MDRTNKVIWVLAGLSILGALLAVVRYSFASYFLPKYVQQKPAQVQVAMVTQAAQNIPTTVYSTAQIASHNSSGDCWLIINKFVYDISGLVKNLGSSANFDVRVCGTDQTDSFSKMLGQSGLTATQLNTFLVKYAVGKTQ